MRYSHDVLKYLFSMIYLKAQIKEYENVNREMWYPYQFNHKSQKIRAQSRNELIGKILHSES